MPDELIEELWQIKDGIAREHGYDVDTLVAHLRTRERMGSRRVVDLRAAREAAEHGASAKRADSDPGAATPGSRWPRHRHDRDHGPREPAGGWSAAQSRATA